MLHDFFALEQFFGRKESALFIEDVIEQYGFQTVCKAIERGHLIKRRICIGPDCGRYLCWLSDEGRYVVTH